jgi:hypothetical protein
MNRWRKRIPLPNPLPSEGRGKDLRHLRGSGAQGAKFVRENLSPALSSEGSKGGEGEATTSAIANPRSYYFTLSAPTVCSPSTAF